MRCNALSDENSQGEPFLLSENSPDGEFLKVEKFKIVGRRNGPVSR